MKIEKFSPENLKLLNAEIKKALETVEQKHGIKIQLGSTRYSDAEYSTKITVKLPDADKQRDEKSFEYAELLGLPADIKDKVIPMNGKKYNVVRFDLAKRKRPVVIVEQGKESPRYLASVEQIQQALGMKVELKSF